MNLAPLDVPALLRRAGLRPDKRLGQNFLIDPTALDRIVAAAEIAGTDDVLEVGPGLGSLTRLLALQARSVVTVELDGKLIPLLQQVLATHSNVRILQGDILTLDPVALVYDLKREGNVPLAVTSAYLVVANIPYYITSSLIRHLLEARLPPKRLVLTVQREVAQRVCAEPGEMSLLALSVQVYGRPRIVAHIPAGAFYPPPEVDSAVVRVDLLDTPMVPTLLLPTFFRLAKAGFSQKRKTLRNALAGGLHWMPQQAAALLHEVGIDPQRRAETLSLDDWKRLTDAYHSVQHE